MKQIFLGIFIGIVLATGVLWFLSSISEPEVVEQPETKERVKIIYVE
jgi:hypothetical protein